MELFKKEPTIKFIKNTDNKKNIIKILLFLLSLIIFISIKGISLSMEFTGGTQIEIEFSSNIEILDIKNLLTKQEQKNVKITHYNTKKNILIKAHKNLQEKKILEKINIVHKKIIIKKVEYIGSELSSTLFKNCLSSLIITMLITIVYITIRFTYSFALGALLALLHNFIITLSFFSILSIEINLATISAILAILGYSINDTVVIFDRIRENKKKYKNINTIDIVNKSLNQTLTRTILTSFLTLLSVVMLLIFGGETLVSFSIALIVGIFAGTYSSIYVSCCFFIKNNNNTIKY